MNRKYFVLSSMCESYFGPAKNGRIKRLIRLNSDPIKRSRLYVYSVGVTEYYQYSYSVRELSRIQFNQLNL